MAPQHWRANEEPRLKAQEAQPGLPPTESMTGDRVPADAGPAPHCWAGRLAVQAVLLSPCHLQSEGLG